MINQVFNVTYFKSHLGFCKKKLQTISHRLTKLEHTKLY